MLTVVTLLPSWAATAAMAASEVSCNDVQPRPPVSVPNEGPAHSFNWRREESRVEGWLWASEDAAKSHDCFPAIENLNATG